ncbi:MAG: hypothetical protein AB8I08_02240 [Sandaracinaceae bacterium]
MLERGTLESFLDTLRTQLPEALPRRYGEFEPPQHQLAEMGNTHLVDYLLERLEGAVVLYPSAPVASLSISTHREPLWIRHCGRKALRAHCVRLCIERSVLEQPVWARGLSTVFRDVSTWWSNGQTEQHPVRSWWWCGVPRTLGHASVIGEPYVGAWPRFVEQAERRGELAFLSNPDWSTPDDVSARIGEVPASLAQPAEAEGQPPPYTYPPLFPFPRS